MLMRTRQLSLRGRLGSLAGLLPARTKDRVALRLAVRSLRQSRRRARNIRSLCEITHTWTGYGAYPSIRSLQHLDEQVRFFEYVAGRKIRYALEVGTCRGGTLFPLLAIAQPDAHVISVDLPGGIHGGGYHPSWSNFFHRAFRSASQRLDLIRGDSQLSSTLDQVKHLLGGKALDYLFIDGDHRYQGVRQDFSLYAQLVRPGGIVAFHDIAEGEPVPTVDVPRFWREIRDLSPTLEFQRPEQVPPFYGIGLFTNWDPKVLDQVSERT